MKPGFLAKIAIEFIQLGAVLLSFLPCTLLAEDFTNSATLTASVAGTNLVVTYSMMNTQGWVTLFAAGILHITQVEELQAA